MGKTKTAFVGEEVPEKKTKKEKPEKVHIAGLKGGQRIKAIEAEPITPEAAEEEKPEKKAKAPKTRGKKYTQAKAKINPGKLYPLKEAIALVKETSYSTFEGAVELHLVVKKTGTSARVTLPHSAGKEKKVEDQEAVEALLALGFSRQRANEALAQLSPESLSLSLEGRVKQALKIIRR